MWVGKILCKAAAFYSVNSSSHIYGSCNVERSLVCAIPVAHSALNRYSAFPIW